jgi:PTH1 family peptidyl-tRNA hydrolase
MHSLNLTQKRKNATTMVMKLIVGLGNPGKEYDGTRHNIGWDAVTMAAKAVEATAFSKKAAFHAEVAEATIEGKKVLFAHPLTFMNLSGNSVQTFKSFFKMDNADILIVQDEMDFPVGTFKFSTGSGPAGHNGILSIQQSMGSRDVARLRIGVSKPDRHIAREDYVLGKFSTAEKKQLKSQTKNLNKAIHDWISQGLTKTMNTWNGVESETT